MRVLVVDDHEGFRKALVTSLNLVNGVEVTGEAGSGEAACESAVELQPDAILMDLSMPGMSGIDAMRVIHRRRKIPVVILTAHADTAIEREAIAAGASSFLAKGTELQILVDTLTSAAAAGGNAAGAAEAAAPTGG